MVIYRAKDLKSMSNEELNEKLQQLRTELSRDKGAVASGTKAENPGKIREVRKTIARILTLIHQRETARKHKGEVK